VPAHQVHFRKLTQPQLQRHAENGATVLIPFGAIEQHGDHLPVDTDTYNAERFCFVAAEAFDDVLVAPAIPWGLSHAHIGRGGTLSLRPATCLSLIADLIDTMVASGFERIVLVNGHHGNKPMLALAVYEAKRLHGLSIGAVTYYDLAGDAFASARATAPGGSGHACEFETSLMLHFEPTAVGDHSAVSRPVEPRTASDFRDLLDPGSTAIGYTFAERFPEGVMGDPRAATAATGSVIFEAASTALIAFVDEFRRLPPHGVRAEPEAS
jgi:creatinine amidohydrolase